MIKKLEANDNAVQDQSGGKPNAAHVQGNALQMNDNSAEGKKPAKSPAASAEKHADGNVQGKSLQVNENSTGE